MHKAQKNEFGQFMEFETITFLPYEQKAIVTAELTQGEIDWINEYHKAVYEKLSPYLNDEEKAKAETEGLLVTESTGAARKAGIREGDIIVNVNGVKIKKTDDLARVLEKNKNLRVLVQRRDGRIFIPVRLK